MLEAVLADEHLNVASRPTLEELSAADDPVSPALFKMLGSPATTFPNLAHNLEGMALFSSTELRLVSDNDCGMPGATTQFWRVRLITPLVRQSQTRRPQDPTVSIAVDGDATRSFL